MDADRKSALDRVNRHFLLEHPAQAADVLDGMGRAATARLFGSMLDAAPTDGAVGERSAVPPHDAITSDARQTSPNATAGRGAAGAGFRWGNNP